MVIRGSKQCLFKASALWADTLYKLKCPSVRLCICPSVRVFTFEVPFKHLFAPTSWRRMFNIFRDLESLGKSTGKKWSQIWTFLFGRGLKSPRKQVCFLVILPYKTWWKPHFLVDFRPLVKGRIANFSISLDIFKFLRFGFFFFFFKKIVFLVFLVHPETTLCDRLETSGRRAYR